MDAKHNIKNQRYQQVDGNTVMMASNNVVDCYLCALARTPKELYASKEFAPDRKVELLFSHATVNKINKSLVGSDVFSQPGAHQRHV